MVDTTVRSVVYSFHMPLFFMISGFLETTKMDFNWQYFKRMSYCLLLPFIVYNIPYIPLLFTDCKMFIASMLTVSVPPNDPTWFFIALFMVKIILTVFARVRNVMLPLTVGLFCLLEYLGINLSTVFCTHAILTGIVFYEIGRLVKPVFTSRFIWLSLPIAFIFTYRSVTHFGRYDMYWGNIDNPIWYLCTTVFSAIAVLAFCKYISDRIPMHIKDNIIFPISRGTMVIVGTHYLFAHLVNKMIFQTYDTLFIKWMYTIALLGMYWIIIQVTFNRFPVLYGKYRK